MSSELERRVRAARDGLPLPAAAATARARERALLAARRRGSRRVRRAALLVTALVVAIAFGVGVGALVAPRGTAASGPFGMGFLPEPGWTVLQTGAKATPDRQALAVATNVRLHPDDAARGIRESSGLPYATLLQLPRNGVVIVALFTRRESEPWNDEYFPERRLPLRVRDAMNTIAYSYQMRPERPLGQHELRARVGDHHVVLHFYFGTPHPSPKLVATAQRQLDRLIIAAEAETDPSRQTNSRANQSAVSRIVDRTVVCPTGDGNPREIDVSGRSGLRLLGDPSKWKHMPSAYFSAGATAIPRRNNTVSASISAGWPPVEYARFHPANDDSLSISTRCQPTPTRASLSTAGLTGSAATQFGDEYDCVVPARVLVRVRSVFRTPTTVRRVRRHYGGNTFQDVFIARGPVREASFVIRTPSGKPIAMATVHESGRTRLFVGDSCGPSA